MFNFQLSTYLFFSCWLTCDIHCGCSEVHCEWSLHSSNGLSSKCLVRVL